MRTPSSLFALLAIPAMAASMAGLVACSSGDTDSSESNQTEAELGTEALKILGAQKIPGARQSCNECHSINQKQLRLWETAYSKTSAVLKDPNKTPKQKLAQLRLDPTDQNSPYSPSPLGVLAAAVYQDDVPEIKEVIKSFQLVYGANAQRELSRWREEVGMPYYASDDSARLSKADFAIVQKYYNLGLPGLEALIPEAPRPGPCVQSISDELKQHIASMKTKGWEARNRDQRIPMFACATPGDPTSCFGQKKDDGTDIFPEVETTAYGRGWKAAGSKLRLLHELPHGTSFWSRNSADGRFISSGGGELGAFMVDLAKQLETRGAETREIGIPASYDPSFMPDNGGFLIQGGYVQWEGNGRGNGRGDGERGDWRGDGHGRGDGTFYCTQDLFAQQSLQSLTFRESQCSSLSNVSLYQSVGRRLADNELSDYFIVNNAFESDDGMEADTIPAFGEDQSIQIHVMVSRGSEGGYQIGQTGSVAAPWEGDTMMSPTTLLTASRLGGEEKQEGYTIRKIKSTLGDDGYKFEAGQVARVCMDGGKANFSFDERYLVTHHYLSRADFPSDEAWAPYAERTASDIYLVDLLTGEKIRVTHMAPGQLALFPHFRSDGWLYIDVRDRNTDKEYYIASDVVVGRP